jgi:hypothetical protein
MVPISRYPKRSFMTKDEKIKRFNELIKEMQGLNQDHEFAIFFSAVTIAQDRKKMKQVFYTDGVFEDINIAIGSGVVSMAVAAEGQGVPHEAIIVRVAEGIGEAELAYLMHEAKTDAAWNSEGGTNRGGAGNA